VIGRSVQPGQAADRSWMERPLSTCTFCE
jgi:hypothetical protein